MLECDAKSSCWAQFLDYMRYHCSVTAFENWLAPIVVQEDETDCVKLEVPNIFVQEYLLSNYKEELCSFLPVLPSGEPAVEFVVNEQKKKKIESDISSNIVVELVDLPEPEYIMKLNSFYKFENFIEGPSNQFAKSAAIGVANRPSRSYNPLFIHGGVGLGKTHLLHGIGHHIRQHHKKMRVQCITTEAFINDLVDSLRNKSVDKMKRFYRSLDVLLVDDIQFLQNRLNFEEEFCNTFESLINQNKQIVIASDKPPSQLRLSERMIARMEWGLVAHIGIPELETRVAILQLKAEQKGLKLSSKVAFYIAEHIYSNVRQLEGAVNRLSAHCRLLNEDITESLVENALSQMLQSAPLHEKISVEQILKSVAAVFQVRVSDLRGSTRTKEIALPRQVAMYLAREMINESLIMLAASFGKTHSTILHACKSIKSKVESDDMLKRRIEMARRNVST